MDERSTDTARALGSMVLEVGPSNRPANAQRRRSPGVDDLRELGSEVAVVVDDSWASSVFGGLRRMATTSLTTGVRGSRVDVGEQPNSRSEDELLGRRGSSG